MYRLVCTLLVIVLSTGNALAAKPRIRAITAFVKIDRANYQAELADANKMLQSAKAEFVRAGYEVQTVRITAAVSAVCKGIV